MRKEESLQIALCTYVKLQFPNAVFTSESSGIRVTKSLAGKMKAQRSKHKLPDFIMLEPRGMYHGLVLELKTKKRSPFLKNGELSTDKHVREQAKTLDILKRKGYAAFFAVGLDQAKLYVDRYMEVKDLDNIPF